MAEADKQRGRIFLHRGDLAQARLCYEQALKDDRQDDSRALSDTLGNLGNVCAMLGDYQEAEQCYREILDIQRRQQDKTAIGQTLVNLGNLQTEAGRHGRAKAYYLEALDII